MSLYRPDGIVIAMSTPRTTSRDAILTAAVTVILRDGLFALTLDAVAREAGLSKGGVLYHFASKDALIAGMIDHFLRQMEDDMARRMAQDPKPRGRWLRAYLDASFAEEAPEGLSPAQARQLYVSLLAAAAINPALMAPVKQFADRWAEQLSGDGGDGLDNLIVWMAADGLWLWDLFGLMPADDKTRAAVIERLKQKTRGGKR